MIGLMAAITSHSLTGAFRCVKFRICSLNLSTDLARGMAYKLSAFGPGGPLLGGHPKALATLNFVSEELEPVSYVHDAGLLRMQADAEFFLQECFRQRGFGFLTRVANDDEVIREPRQPVAGFGHGMVKRREIDTIANIISHYLATGK